MGFLDQQIEEQNSELIAPVEEFFEQKIPVDEFEDDLDELLERNETDQLEKLDEVISNQLDEIDVIVAFGGGDIDDQDHLIREQQKQPFINDFIIDLEEIDDSRNLQQNQLLVPQQEDRNFVQIQQQKILAEPQMELNNNNQQKQSNQIEEIDEQDVP
eukprot:TRINITY_DN21464_c0_g2_i4.p1 TRINITY_DN21464_c0_g2~~TRINITY_DN21464_c0_g2_i4.p1  ORF type:complete len:158 (-),score=47.00 TRINITY_DN21464_c0_g2_i4:402-875(-)